ncbi:MAG: DsbA family protein [Cycloclasticus sp.]|nr:DsbA family protein [Cycloclasticus sp.]MBG95466.1 DsbA family protein [Cycloclasticus sp.]HAI96050.1 DsbA family protein [Methylococcaceae bacterium]|tara:strand:- start:64 stop:672 length:609 start_codon:yes stop_codon:yes gene_type:complete
MDKVLYYVHDPMCSWCWGFRQVWQQVQEKLPATITVRYLLGGLAADSDQPMPIALQKSIRATWQRIEQRIPGTQFNDDFWTKCQPRRSTYPSCRAVVAAKEQNPAAEKPMILAIQQAYYLQAKNPSDEAVLIECAKEVGLNTDIFAEALNSATTKQQLLAELKFARSIRANSFPSLILEEAGKCRPLVFDYNDPEVLLRQLT